MWSGRKGGEPAGIRFRANHQGGRVGWKRTESNEAQAIASTRVACRTMRRVTEHIMRSMPGMELLVGVEPSATDLEVEWRL